MISIVNYFISINFSHVHLFKYEDIKYSNDTLGYTRIGIGDPNDNSFYFQHCKLENARTSCFHVLKESNEQMMENNCYNGNVPSEEIEDHQYMLNESLVNEKSKNNRVLMSRTNNFMPNFIENVLNYGKFFLKESHKNNWANYKKNSFRKESNQN